MGKKKKGRGAAWLATGVMAVIIAVALLYTFGVISPNSLFAAKYTVKGIDVSHYQGDIDWDKVRSNKDISFVYIKATEGKTNQDDHFQKNRDGVRKAGLKTGAYHYFTLSSTGEEQAANFIATVPKAEDSLPPVVDLEAEGPDKVKYRQELKKLLSTLEKHYGEKPILYVVYPVYDEYIKGDFKEYPIWIRSTFLPPRLSDEREWRMWQYWDRGKVDGIAGYVDMDVYKGSLDELMSK